MNQLGFHTNVRQPITAPAYVIPQSASKVEEKPAVTEDQPSQESAPHPEDGFVPSEPTQPEPPRPPVEKKVKTPESPELKAAKAEVKKARWGRVGSVLKTAAFLAVGAAAVATLPVSGTVALGLSVTGAVGTVLSGVEVGSKSEKVAQAKSKVEALANTQPNAPLTMLEDAPHL